MLIDRPGIVDRTAKNIFANEDFGDDQNWWHAKRTRMPATQFMTEWVLWKWGQAVRLEFQQNGHPAGIQKVSCKNGRKTLPEDKNHYQAAERPAPKIMTT